MTDIIELYHSKDWAIGASAGWNPKKGINVNLECPACKGTGGHKSHPMFDLDGPDWENCSTCHGNKTVRNPDVEPKPRRIPKAYLDHMSKAHYEFLDSKKNRNYLKGKA